MDLPAVSVVYLLRHGPEGRTDVLLGYKKTGLGRGRLVGPGGKVEPGESVRDAAVREIREETGLLVEATDLIAVGMLDYLFPTHPSWSQRSHVFVCRRWRGEAASSDEIDPRWFDIDDIPFERMWDDARRWLPAVLRGRTVRAAYTFGDDRATVVAEDRRGR